VFNSYSISKPSFCSYIRTFKLISCKSWASAAAQQWQQQQMFNGGGDSSSSSRKHINLPC